MTTYEQGRAPEGAPVTWRHYSEAPEFKSTAWTIREGCDPADPMALGLCGSVEEINAICRAFHLAKLAEDYAQAKAAMDAAATSADMESVRSAYYDAARALCEAVR